MKKNFLSLSGCLLFLACSLSSWSQGENTNWCFGYHVGISFGSGGPVFFQDSMQVREGAASVSDAAGNLLFYTSGSKIWDRNHNLMPNGSGLSGNIQSGYNSVAIMKSPANPNQYYIVTTDEIESGMHNAYYTVVDMSLNGGLGDAIPAQSSVVLSTGVTEGVCIAPAGDCVSYWIILHRFSANEYRAFKVDASGVSTVPVVSAGSAGFLGGLSGYGNFGNIQFNNAFNRIIRTGGSKTETAAFDRNTGIFSGFVMLNTVPNIAWYACFSPDDNLVYFSGYPNLCQMNISLLPSIAAVEGSILPLGLGLYSGMRRGPDNKIYAVNFNSHYIGRVNNPNVLGMGCSLDPTALTPPPYALSSGLGNIDFLELGNPVIVMQPDTLPGVTSDTLVCFLQQLTLHGNSTYQSYQWSTGTTGPTTIAAEDGVYWLKGTRDCKIYTDTFHVHFANFTLDLGPDTGICAGQTKLIDATVPGAAYLWQDGSTNATYTASSAGTYRVRVSKDNCTAQDTLNLDVFQPSLRILEPDTVLCKGKPVMLHAIATPASQFLWSNGSTGNQTETKGTGIYSVIATSLCGTLREEVTITELECNCIPFVPNAFSPNGDNRNDQLMVRLICPGLSGFYFAVYNRYGQQVFESWSPDKGWDGLQNEKYADEGTYYYSLRYNIDGQQRQKKGDITLLR
ncbi:gliding motility-associated C-terminal domain-containing protein [Taibaiella koreensis]|uniref:gliding motility-associated C-terminal domain-containing protein n=1 Tax=Taibaiella koreensis TaxID=1268548 RepID=UPI0013C2C7B3|nr:gliding motility-associated C-terminal domain-containing protein [Taibaiella koreensis]